MKTMLGIALIAIGSSVYSYAGDRVIYGQDDRKDLYEVVNPLHQKWAASTVALIKSSNLEQNASGVVSVKTDTFGSMPMFDEQGNESHVCSTERFADQPNPGFCSGSLIGKNLILTAGHCMQSTYDCQSAKFVFDYAVKSKGQYPTQIPESKVYGCKNVLHSQIPYPVGADFAIVELDRDVTDRAPLPLARGRLQQEIAAGTKLVMIGHPVGLPTKIDDGAKVRNANGNGYFVANTDSYGGNSGSAVLNADTGEIEGVLVRGEMDFVRKGSCFVSNHCTDDGCSGEEVTRVSAVIPFLPH